MAVEPAHLAHAAFQLEELPPQRAAARTLDVVPLLAGHAAE
jgi:hypothetical protein